MTTEEIHKGNVEFFNLLDKINRHEDTLAELVSFIKGHIGRIAMGKEHVLFEQLDVLRSESPLVEQLENAWFTDEELQKIILAYVATCKDGATKEEIEEIVDWCVDIRIKNTFLRLVLEKGFLLGRNKDGEIGVSPPKERKGDLNKEGM